MCTIEPSYVTVGGQGFGIRKMAVTSGNRRGFLRGDFRAKKSSVRPPWAVEEAVFVMYCSRCNACVEHCPEHIIEPGSGGFPQINFHKGECSFCGKCRDACPDKALSLPSTTPWNLQPVIADTCLAKRQVTCFSCVEQCEQEAIRMSPVLRGVAQPEIITDKCSCCGACVAPCPVSAIDLRIPKFASSQAVSVTASA